MSKTCMNCNAPEGTCDARLEEAMRLPAYTLGIDIGSTTVKIAILDEAHRILFSDYERHFANIRETLSRLLDKAYQQFGNLPISGKRCPPCCKRPMISWATPCCIP